MHVAQVLFYFILHFIFWIALVQRAAGVRIGKRKEDHRALLKSRFLTTKASLPVSEKTESPHNELIIFEMLQIWAVLFEEVGSLCFKCILGKCLEQPMTSPASVSNTKMHLLDSYSSFRIRFKHHLEGPCPNQTTFCRSFVFSAALKAGTTVCTQYPS